MDHWRGSAKSEAVRGALDGEVKRIVTEAYTLAMNLLKVCCMPCSHGACMPCLYDA
jgi:hypothetical protein